MALALIRDLHNLFAILPTASHLLIAQIALSPFFLLLVSIRPRTSSFLSLSLHLS